MSRPIVLLTDYGSDEFYAGVTRAVLAASAPASSIVDLTHDIPAYDIARASFVLARAFDYLPAHAVVVVVVDPGVGTTRRGVMIEIGERTLVGPDNGFASDVVAMHGAARFVSIDEAAAQDATGSRVRGSTFHGRDVFAPVAAAMARGAPAENFGSVCNGVVMLRDVPTVSVEGRRVTGEGRHVDRFGNVLSDIPRPLLERVFGADLARVRVRAGSVDIGPLRNTYAEGAVGTPIALLNSWDLVEVAVREGRACDILAVTDPRHVRFELVEV